MLKGGCINPEIMKAISLCGHGDQILIADGNYPLDAKTGGAQKVYLGLTAGVPEVTQVLDGLDRWAFYGACCEPKVRLAISTGEKRVFANILLTVGVA